MKIRINGCMTLEQYANMKDMSEEFKYAMESLELPAYDEFDHLVASNESIMGDMIKTTYKVTKGTVKAGVKGVKYANKQWANLKNKWAQIKPQIIKLLKQFALGLQNLWHKFLNYNKKYKEMGQKINNIINFSVNQMQTIPNVRVYYHLFNAKMLKGMLDVVSNWMLFVEIVTVGYKNKKSGLFSGDVPAPDTIAEAIKKNDLNRLRSLVQDFSNGIGKLNAKGDLTIGVLLDNMFGWGIANNLPDEIRDRVKKNNIGLSEYIKHAILGPVVEKEYSDANRNEFVQDMTGGNASYLRLVASILNNNVLEDALKKGGVSTKKGTDTLVRLMDQMMKEASVAEQINRDKLKQQQAQADANIANQKLQAKVHSEMNKGSAMDQAVSKGIQDSQNFGNVSDMKNVVDNGVGNTENPNPDDTISGLAELYAKNYVIFVTKLSNTYGNLVRGILAATYEIISEAGGIINTIEASANRTK